MYKQVKSTNSIVKGKTKLRQLICFSVLFSGAFYTSSLVAAEQPSYGKLAKQLDIMNNIFVSSLKSQEGRLFKNTKIDNLYLAGQGVVFTVKSTNNFSLNSHSFSFSFSDSAVPVAPVAPIAPSEHDVEFEYFEDNDELAEQMEEAYELQRENNREFREQQRELSYELRDLERESRDLSYQLRNVSKEEKIELAKEQKAVKAQKAELEQKRAVLSKKSKEMKKQQRINQEKKLASRKEHFQKLTRSLVETLCTYGNSLKSLPKNEYVNIVLKSAGDKANNSYQDKVLVLSKRDITECAIDKISADKLLTSMKNYQF
jgi:hypothetical protein